MDDLLDSLSKAPQGLSLGELAQKVGLPKGTTHRLISSLAYFDYVQQDPLSRKYKLGFKLVTLGNQLLDQVDLRVEARPFLFELAQSTHETAHLVIWDNDEGLYIDKIQLSSDGLHMTSRTGYRVPLYCTAVGKVLMAHLPPVQMDRIIEQKGLPPRTVHTLTNADEFKAHLQRIRKEGYALDNDEHCEGVRCVAAPIYNMNGSVVAAISISAPAVRITPDIARQAIKDRVIKTAKKISYQLGYHRSIVMRGDQ